ncbi:MAG: type 4a pilus biogenesis protein PilO [Acidimicrobiales bacterium]
MKAKIIALAVLVSVVLGGAWYMFLWSPQGKDLDTAKEELAAAEKRGADLRVRLTRLQKLEANASLLEAQRVKFATAIPDTDDLDDFIIQMSDRAAAAGVTFMSISPTEPQAGRTPTAAAGAASPAAPTSVGLQMQVTGDYFALLRFLENLRDGPRLVVVDNLALAKGGGQGTSANALTASIGGKMFISKGTAAATTSQTTTSSTSTTVRKG